MTPDELAVLIKKTLEHAVANGSINLAEGDIPEVVKVERPRSREHGDWATNVALQLAKKAGQNPRDFATLLANSLTEESGIKKAEVAGPGFLNITLEAASAGELARTILEAGDKYGKGDKLAGQHVNVEFVSANPTGPLHVGGARWAAVGDAICRTLEANGARVTREYYFNDHGSQIDRFSKSLLARALGQEAPEDGYGGQYIQDIADQVRAIAAEAGDPDPATLPEAEAMEYFRKHGVALMFEEIKRKLESFGVHFDVFFHEDSLYESGATEKALEILDSRGLIFQDQDATWLRTTDFGDDKDRVIVKKNGETTYFVGDIAYYLDKRNRGADCAIYILGADHHGYIGRMMAICAAFGDVPGANMEIIIGQLVNLVQGGQPVRMSKRAGNIVTMDDLVEAVGVDAARYALTRASIDTALEIDLDLLASATNENPVYYVQYAHARTCAVARNAAEAGLDRASGFDPAALDDPADAELLGVLAQFPEVVAQSATLREPHRVARYLESLAAAYHGWYGKTRVIPRGDDAIEAGHLARLWLNDAAGQVLRNGLTMLGVSAPERM